jgi:Flp pilus assembly protein protease CpaA
MADAPEGETGLPPSLRFLKALVIVLTLTMIGGVITVVALIVTRMPTAFQTAPRLPDDLALPQGETAQSVTFGAGWVAVVTVSNRLLVFSADGTLRQDVALDLPAPATPAP